MPVDDGRIPMSDGAGIVEAVGKQATLAEVVKDFPVDPLHRFFQRDLRTRFDLNRNRPLTVDPVDLLWAAAELQVGLVRLSGTK